MSDEISSDEMSKEEMLSGLTLLGQNVRKPVRKLRRSPISIRGGLTS